MWLVIATILLSFAGCGDAPTASSAEAPAPSAEAAAPSEAPATEDAPAEAGVESDGEPIAFSYLMQQKFMNWMLDLKWYPYALEANNAEIELVDGGASDTEYISGVDQRLISNTFPDAGIITHNQSVVYGSQGAFLDLAPLIDQYAPNIKAYMEANPEYQSFVTGEDGRIFGLPTENAKIAQILFYRADMFEAAGVPSVPTTIDEFTDALRMLQAHYGADDPTFFAFNGREDFLKFMPFFSANAGVENGVAHGVFFDKPEYSMDIHAPGFRQMLEWYNMLYNEKLINPEWASGAFTQELWEAAMLTGKGAVCYDSYTRPATLTQQGKPNDPNFDMQVMPYLQTIDGQDAVIPTLTRYRSQFALVINAQSEDKAAGIMRFMDYFFSPEGQELVSWGVEGESFTEENGEKKFLVDFSVEDAVPDGTPRWTFMNDRVTFAKPIDNLAQYQWNVPLVAAAATELFPKSTVYSPGLRYTAEQAQEYSNLNAAVKPFVISGAIAFVTGDRSFDEFDAFLAEADAQGYSRMIELQQAAYDLVNQ